VEPPDPHPVEPAPVARAVPGHPGQGDEAGLEQDGEGLGQQGIQGGLVRHTKVAQGVIVDGEPPADPAVGVVGLAEASELPGPADALLRRVEPEGQEEIGRW